MATKKKLLQAAAGSAGGAGGLDIPDVFSTTLYTGNATERDITTGIDLAGEGGLLWIKNRSSTSDHSLFSTLLGARKSLNSNSTQSAYASTSPSPADKDLKSFNSDGFSIFAAGYNANLNVNGFEYTSWTWRKAPKFFDVVTYSGTGVAGLTVDHNLGSVPGMIIIKSYDDSRDWAVYHRGVDATNPEDYAMVLQSTVVREDNVAWFNDTAPTDTQFTVGNKLDINRSGYNYVAYLFAHNDGDGEFGPDSDQDIIKCGSYTGNGSSTGPVIDLGFEPQWLLIKKATGGAQSWAMYDTMRGIASGGDDAVLFADTTSDELSSYASLSVTSTGFKLDAPHDWVNTSGETYIYMAIRRGQLAVPEDATEVFAIDTLGGTSPNPPGWNAGFPVDFAIRGNTASFAGVAEARLLGAKYLVTNGASSENPLTLTTWDYMDGFFNSTSVSSNYYSWMWKRAPGYFDVVPYTGNGVAGRTVSHNLGVAPEMMWVKARNFSAGHWLVYHKGANGGTNPEQYYALLNDSSGFFDGTTQAWNDTAPTSSVFTLGTGNSVNSGSYNYIAYLFASLAGISKVGSYTGNGSSQTINCGFSNGARFILIKRIDSAGTQPFDWYIWDTERGIVAGNDPHLSLNTSAAEVTSDDSIDPENSGFIVNQVSATNINASSGEYIFYAIA